jgi:hypothetical protein
MQPDEPPRQPFQYSLKLIFAATGATAILLGAFVGSALVVGTLLAVLVLSMLSIAGWLVAVDEWRSPRRSNLNLAIALWLAVTSLVASLFLGLVVYNALRPGT